MSVHGEYSRSLEALLDRLRAWSDPRAIGFCESLEAARVGAHPDLSAAARAGRAVALAIREDPDTAALEGLQDPIERFEAHLGAILG